MVDTLLYRSTINALQHFYVIRSGINFVVNKLRQYMQLPPLYKKVVTRVLRYLKGTLHHRISFKSNHIASNEVSLTFYADADWGGDKTNRRSVYGHYLLLSGHPIVWSSK